MAAATLNLTASAFICLSSIFLVGCSDSSGCSHASASDSTSFDGPFLFPDNRASIHYYGRFDFEDPKMPRFSWPMTGFSFTVEGSSNIYGKFAFPKVGARLRVIVDGKTHGFVEQSAGSCMQHHKIASDLDTDKPHTVQVFKVSEICGTLSCQVFKEQNAGDGVMTFGGFQLDTGGKFLAPPKQLGRRLEFIGDSDTAGWCADGPRIPIFGTSSTEDAYVTWAQQLARALQAETMVEAVSGWGVSSASTPIQDVLDYTTGFDKAIKWNYSNWIPDAVVILIGPNDENGNLPGNTLVPPYLDLLQRVASHYNRSMTLAGTSPKIIHVCGGSLNGLDPCKDIQTANKQFNDEQERSGSPIRGYYTSITQAHWTMINAYWGMSEYNGCDGHYNEKGHRVLMQDILPAIQKIMNWQDMENVVV